MFEDVVADPEWIHGGSVPDDDLDDDAALERLFAEADAIAEADPGWMPQWPPTEWPPTQWPPADVDEPVAGYGTCAPSGWLALDLDTVTADPARLDDHTLIEAIVGFDRIGSWAAARQARLLAELDRRRPTDKAPYSARWAGLGSEYAPDEAGVALHLSRGAACARIGLACRLLAVLPDTHALWETGRIDTPKARAIDDATWMLAPDLARAVQDRVLPKAPEQTLAQLKAALARAVIAADPQGAEARHREARRDRRVVLTPEADGMASLWTLLTATDAAGAFTWLTRLARGLGPDDPRNMDTRRADILGALLNGRLVLNTDTDSTDTAPATGEPAGTDPATAATDGTGSPGTGTGTGTVTTGMENRASGAATSGAASPEARGVGSESTADESTADENPGSGTTSGGTTSGGTTATGAATAGSDATTAGPGRPIQPVTPGKPLIQIVMSYSTLIGADDQPAELVGHGPIPAGLAREVAADAVWRRLVTDPLSGTLLDYGRTTYHPPAGLADHVRARDVYCRAPGCRRKAADGELDHIIAWSDGGTTSEPNLGAYCRHDHRLKTYAGWRVHAHPDGSLTWTTPTGHRHTTRPHDHRQPVPVSTAPPEPEPPPPGAPAPDDPGQDPPPF